MPQKMNRRGVQLVGVRPCQKGFAENPQTVGQQLAITRSKHKKQCRRLVPRDISVPTLFSGEHHAPFRNRSRSRHWSCTAACRRLLLEQRRRRKLEREQQLE